ncbi:MAG: DUF4270 domain-containing protein [Chryseobacterium sp.]|jgi:hypothetical protein|uniref:DUF4270 family protein n=1 Tax=Chryseobacterium sp. TaxID=1871047 RepID=UPI002825D85B|nr:DUF4270 family protein [Chryseobacterium sp.]MDR2235402.1 DUF4270 domain-containing protein [Chryseobacterium sp.]
MTHTVKRTFAMLLLAVFGSALLYNCEPDPDSLGEQLFIKDAVAGNEKILDLIAYNINNNDTIASDASRLVTQINTNGVSPTAAVLGAFHEGQFGMQKASFVSQLRLRQYDFDFGTAPKVDSVVMVVRPSSESQYKKDSVDARPAADIDFPVGNETVAASIEKKFYPVVKYGRGKIGTAPVVYHVKVHEVTTFLDVNNPDLKKSNATIGTGDLLGSTTFNGNYSAVTVTKKSDNSSIFAGDIGMRIPLDKNLFQTKILDKNKKPELLNAANFVRYFKGIRISVDETNGYLWQFSPDNTEVIMYYSNETTSNGTVTRTQQAPFKFALAGARLGHYQYDRAGSAWETAKTAINTVDGNDKLFLQGMGGPSIAVKIRETELDQLRTLYNDNKAAIINARIRIYTDNVSWNNKYPKPSVLTLATANNELIPDGFTSDLLAGFGLLTPYDLDKNPAYYDFNVTKTVKEIVEKAGANKPLIINAGDFIKDASGLYYGFKYTSRAFAMDRAVFVGSVGNKNNGIQLRVTYGTKQ